jgi:hypothetical protein
MIEYDEYYSFSEKRESSQSKERSRSHGRISPKATDTKKKTSRKARRETAAASAKNINARRLPDYSAFGMR